MNNWRAEPHINHNLYTAVGQVPKLLIYGTAVTEDMVLVIGRPRALAVFCIIDSTVPQA